MQDGTVIPVQVDAQGRLVAEGLQGVAGPQGPPGADGGSFALPPNPLDGQVLGWENGAFAWLSGLTSEVRPIVRLISGNGPGSCRTNGVVTANPSLTQLQAHVHTSPGWVPVPVGEVAAQDYIHMTRGTGVSGLTFSYEAAKAGAMIIISGSYGNASATGSNSLGVTGNVLPFAAMSFPANTYRYSAIIRLTGESGTFTVRNQQNDTYGVYLLYVGPL